MRELKLWLDALAAGATPDFEECLSRLGGFFPWLERFADTPQEPEWHGEGNVAIHTSMVMEALYQLLEGPAQHICGSKRQALILAALLHDIAKPVTTRIKLIRGVERLAATGHEEQGASYLAPRLMALPLDYPVVAMILGLVGFHQVPKLLVVRNQGYSCYLHLALNVDLELMYWLERADMQGRVCADQAEQLDMLAQFALFAQEYGLWQVANPRTQILPAVQVKNTPREQVYLDNYAVAELAGADIVMAEEAIARTYRAASVYGHLYVMCGISGSGKSSWIQKYLADYHLISLDEIRAEVHGDRSCQKDPGRIVHLARDRLKAALAKRRNIVWDATNLRLDYRKVLCDLGRDYGALVTLVVFHLQIPNLKANDRSRRFTVGGDVIDEQVNSLQWPAITEAHRMIIVGDKGRTLARFGSFQTGEPGEQTEEKSSV
ncbi:HD domain protein [Vibrio aerogenes CECT 7868]|uniref:HD domain protein n=1 Tax=Vibrio aerogenes CECT 7868 TaxID=1216006 RepID=A0A1M6APL1_9VIBR|nr:AAA family ATPase [Vibrio aerogenes]SHI38430.1 HD domain protein [Vibrio aerogenes CECT 7868]